MLGLGAGAGVSGDVLEGRDGSVEWEDVFVGESLLFFLFFFWERGGVRLSGGFGTGWCGGLVRAALCGNVVGGRGGDVGRGRWKEWSGGEGIGEGGRRPDACRSMMLAVDAVKRVVRSGEWFPSEAVFSTRSSETTY